MKAARLLTSEGAIKLRVTDGDGRLLLESDEAADRFLVHVTGGKFTGKLPLGSKVRAVALRGGAFFYQVIDCFGRPLSKVAELSPGDAEDRILSSLVWQPAR